MLVQTGVRSSDHRKYSFTDIENREAKFDGEALHVGLQIEMGIHWPRFRQEAASLWIAVAVAWIPTSIFIGMTGNLEIAFSFGNLVAACMAVIYAHKLSHATRASSPERSTLAKVHAE